MGCLLRCLKVPDAEEKVQVNAYLSPEDRDWILAQVGTVFDSKSAVVRTAVKAMRKRGALKTLEELQED